MDKQLTIRDIAKKANVSHATVSRVLAGSPLVAEKTRMKIQQLIDEIGYVPNAMAQGLATNRSNIIGMVIPDIINPYFAEIAKGLKDVAAEAGYNIFFCDTDNDIEKEIRYIEELYNQRVSGLIITPVSDNFDHIVKRFPYEGPIVFLSYQPDDEKANYVMTNSYNISHMGTRYLLQLGHRDIAFIGHEENRRTSTQRYEGYRAAMAEYGAEPFTGGELRFAVRKNIGYELTKELLLKGPLPTAIMAYNDMTALEAIEAIEDFGLSVPDDISIVGVDDVYISNLHRIQLTTVSQPKYRIGEECARILIDKIQGSAGDKPIQKILEPDLVIRKTCLPFREHAE